MAENYKHLYEQTKKMLAMYQDELIPGFRKKIEELEGTVCDLRSKWQMAETHICTMCEHFDHKTDGNIVYGNMTCGEIVGYPCCGKFKLRATDNNVAYKMKATDKDTNVLTNADRIRAMTDEELGLFLTERYAKESVLRVREQGYEPTATQIKALHEGLYLTWMRWLQQPAEDDDEKNR